MGTELRTLDTGEPYRQDDGVKIRLLSVSICLGIVAVAGAVPSVAQPVEPRLQWNANFGYCGETSFISAGMRFGQYTSQWTARALASPRVPQTRASSQLLLGGNDLAAARRMKLATVAFDTGNRDTPARFLDWVNSRFVRGDVVIIGVNNNARILGEPIPGQIGSYDHIVPVLGISESAPSDTITISDNGLHNIGRDYPFRYSYRFSDFPLSRRAANLWGGPIYSLALGSRHYGTAVTGIVDPLHETIPVRLTSSSDGEGLQNQSRLVSPPPASQIRLTAHVQIPDVTRSYTVYMYDRFSKVPTSDFAAHSANAVTSWTIPAHSGKHWSVTVSALSSDTRAFRAVRIPTS
jgi:hypothetical protein